MLNCRRRLLHFVDLSTMKTPVLLIYGVKSENQPSDLCSYIACSNVIQSLIPYRIFNLVCRRWKEVDNLVLMWRYRTQTTRSNDRSYQKALRLFCRITKLKTQQVHTILKLSIMSWGIRRLISPPNCTLYFHEAVIYQPTCHYIAVLLPWIYTLKHHTFNNSLKAYNGHVSWGQTN